MPLVPDYPATAGDIDDVVGDLSGSSQSFVTLADTLGDRARAAAGGVEGLLVGPVTTVADPATGSAQALGQAALWASGATSYFGTAVRRHQSVIDRVNREWDAAAADDFGVTAPYVPGGASPEQAREAQDLHDGQVSAARTALRTRLLGEVHDSEASLDAAATRTAGMLDRGPNEADGRTLIDSGVLDGLLEVLDTASNPRDVAAATLFAAPEAFSRYVAGRLVMTVPGSLGPTVWVKDPFFTVSSQGVATRIEPGWRNPYPTGPSVVPDGPGSGRWLTRARALKYGGLAASAGLAGWDQWNRDAGLPTDERVARTVAQGGTVAAGVWAGAAIGTALCPGLGTVGGAVVGLVAGAVGGAVVDYFNDDLVDAAGELGDWTGDRLSDLGDELSEEWDDLGDTADDVKDWAGDTLDDLTPW